MRESVICFEFIMEMGFACLRGVFSKPPLTDSSSCVLKPPTDSLNRGKLGLVYTFSSEIDLQN